MIFDLNASEGEWFQFFESRINEKGEVVYDEPKPDAGKVRVRLLAPFFEQRLAARKKKYEFILNPSTRAMERVGYYEDLPPDKVKAERDDTWDYAITGWENFFDGSGASIPCTRENKIKLMAHPVFDRFVARCLQLLASAGTQAREESEKNSSAG